jgi:NNP family nitrate/nitrite transporter-like MFS transporter
MGETKNSSFFYQGKALFFLVLIFFLSFLSRVVFSPLMPTIEQDLKLSHGEAGSLFFIISLGYSITLLGSGFISSKINHRRTIILSSLTVGGALLAISISHDLWMIRFGLLGLGMGAGLYLPSGIATIGQLISPGYWGRAFAIHEVAPNLGFVISPLFAEVLLSWGTWRGVLMVLGMASVLAGFVFFFLGKRGSFRSETPHYKIVGGILFTPSLWILVLLFTLSVGAQFGVYTVLPLYLVSEEGMERIWANTLLGLSRISPLFTVLLSGWLTDRIGLKQTLTVVLLVTGLMTVMFGVLPRFLIVVIVFLQPMLATCFFPAGFTALSRIVSPNVRMIVVSLTVLVSYFLGGGAIPAGLGFIGELGSFSTGFILLGGLLLGGVILVRYLKFSDDSA